MKIQFFGGTTFGAFGKKARIVFDPTDNFAEKNLDFTTSSNGRTPQGIDAKKTLSLPGEFEISNVLVKSLAQKNRENTIFKVIMEELSIVNCGNLVDTPDKQLFEELGEDIDILIINISEKFPAKKVKDLLETIEPRVAFIGGDSTKFAELNGIMAITMGEENPISISRSTLSEDKSEYYILTA
jgi:hypothetical protein